MHTKRKKFIWFFILLLLVFWRVPQLNHAFFDFFNRIGLGATDSVTKYNAEAPVKLDSKGIEKRLSELSKQYPEFQSVYENREDYPEELLSSLCNTPEMIDFVKGYLTAEKKASGKLTRKELSEGIPLLLQWDKRWGYAPYGNSNIGISGCAPTCLSMVIVGLTANKKATPYQVAKFAEEKGYYYGRNWNSLEYHDRGRSLFWNNRRGDSTK